MKKEKVYYNEKGITLIALVITIIALLILAVVSISILTGENGILTQAENAREENKAGAVQEAVNLWKTNKNIDKYADNETKQSLDELVNDLEKQGLITENQKEQILTTGKVTISGKEIVFWDISGIVKIGDYVDYKPQEEIKSYTIYEKNSGYSKEQTINQEEFQWRVLNINENGTVDLISENVTSNVMYLKGARGYNNGVYLLNDLCNSLYGNPALGATARSLNVEDIQNKLVKKIYQNSKSANVGTKYGEVYSGATEKWYPLQMEKNNGVQAESIQENLIDYETEEQAISEAELLNVTQSYWYGDINSMKKYYDKPITRTSEADEIIYYQLLEKDDCWLASRYTNINTASSVYYGIRSINTNIISGKFLYISSNGKGEANRKIKVIVSIPSRRINIDREYEKNGNKWSIL